MTRTIGVRGQPWRAVVDGAGCIRPADGSRPLAWRVAADDAWHDPSREGATRQRWYRGTPVCETRLRVPGGDIVQKIWCLADSGGLTMMEFSNESSMAVAIALTRPDIMASRPVSSVAPAGTDLPEGSVVMPLAHGSSVRAALRHAGPLDGPLPADLPGADKAVTGWLTACAVASELSVADVAGRELVPETVRERCDLLLLGPEEGSLGALLEWMRLGEGNDDALVEAVIAAEVLLRRATRRIRPVRRVTWDLAHRLVNLARLCAPAGHERALADIARAWLAVVDLPADPLPAAPPDDPVDTIAWIESQLVRPNPAGGTATVWPAGIIEPWRGAPIEARGLAADPHRRLSFAVRWHGARPALLWETDGPEGLVLDDGIDGTWTTTDARGEVLLGDPRR